MRGVDALMRSNGVNARGGDVRVKVAKRGTRVSTGEKSNNTMGSHDAPILHFMKRGCLD